MPAIAKLKLLASRKAADRPMAAAPPASAAADEDDLPIPSDIKTVFLGGLFLLAMLAACYVASEIGLPIVLAFVLSLVLQPAMRVLERIRLPRGIAAMFLILVLFGSWAGWAPRCRARRRIGRKSCLLEFPNCRSARAFWAGR
jgi:hypothetical protein